MAAETQWNLKQILDSGQVDQSIVDAVKRLKLAIEDIQNLQAELDAKLSQIATQAPILGNGTPDNPLTINLPPVIGDMTTDVYDPDHDGVVNDSERLGGKTPDQYASASHTHLAAAITNFDAAVSIHPDVKANSDARHEHPNIAVLGIITNSGSSTNYLGQDGLYHPLPEQQGDGHTHTNLDLLNSLTDAGDGSKYLADDGTYKFIPVALIHSHGNKAILDIITDTGDGSKALADNGAYVTFLRTVAVDGTTIAGDGTPGNPLRVIGGTPPPSDTIDGNDQDTTLDGGNASGTGDETIDGGTA